MYDVDDDPITVVGLAMRAGSLAADINRLDAAEWYPGAPTAVPTVTDETEDERVVLGEDRLYAWTYVPSLRG